jgi:hypothetical protein
MVSCVDDCSECRARSSSKLAGNARCCASSKAVTSDSLSGKGKVALGGKAAPIVDLLIDAAVVMEKAL